MNRFALGLGLKRRLTATRKWAIRDTKLTEKYLKMFTVREKSDNGCYKKSI